MNRAVSAMYAISIVHPDHGPYTPEEKDKMIERIKPLCDEIARLEAIVDDPFIAGYLEAKRRGSFSTSACVTEPK